MKDLNFNNLFRVTVFLVFAIGFFFVLIVGKQVIVPLVVSFFLAFLLMPLAKFLERHRFSKTMAALSSLVLAILAISGIGIFFGNQVRRFSKDLGQIGEGFEDINATLPDFMSDAFSRFDAEAASAFLEENIGGIFDGLANVAGAFTFAIVVPIYVVLILIYRDLFREFLYRVFDRVKKDEAVAISDKRDIRQMLPRIKTIVQQYILGMFYVICILFVLNSIALLSLGIEHALFFAAFAAVLNIIPFVGPLLGSILPILFALLTKDSLFYPAAVLLAFLVIQTAESNLITPNIVGKNVSLNPLVTLVTLFIGAAVWGLVGMVLFIPLVAVLKEVMASIEGLESYAYVLGTGEREKSGPGVWTRLYNWTRSKF